MIFLYPVICGRVKKASDLTAGVIKIVARPFAVAYIGVRILKKGSAVIFFKGIIIYRKMNGDKVQYNADVILVTFVNKSL